MTVKVAPELEEFVKQVNVAIADAKSAGLVVTPELAREKLAALSVFVTNKPDIPIVEDKLLDCQTHQIPVRIYNTTPDESNDVLIYFHGGGHMCGDINLYDPMCRKIAVHSQCIVLSVEYRLAPEYPYPCGLNDAEAVVKNYKQLVDGMNCSGHVYIAGDSGGAAICASLTAKQVADPELKFSKQILIYPSVDYTLSCASIDELAEGFFLEKSRIEWYFEHYFKPQEDRVQASPLFNPVNNNSPATLVITAECDPLKDEGKAYAQKLKTEGVEVESYEFKGMIHAFMNLEDLVPKQTEKLFQKIGDFIRRR